VLNGFSDFFKGHSSGDYSQPPGRALMKDAAESYYPDLPAIWKNPFVKHWFYFPNVFYFYYSIHWKDEPFLFAILVVKEPN